MNPKTPRLWLLVAAVALLAQACATGPVRRPLCTEEFVRPPREPMPEAVLRVFDPQHDLLLNHPLFEQLYDVVYRDASSVPVALDLRGVQVESTEEGFVFEISTFAGDLQQELSRDGGFASYGVYVDVDGNGVSDLMLTTTNNAEERQGVIVSSTFEQVADVQDLQFRDGALTMLLPRSLAPRVVGWVAFSAYSPSKDIYHPTAREDVWFVPRVDVVPSGANTGGMVTSYVGPGSCQVTSNWIVLNDGSQVSTCPASGPYTTVPGTSTQGKLWWRKTCGNQRVDWWCVAAAFGVLVDSPAGGGWVGRCPYPYGWNDLNQWKVSASTPLFDKTFHVVYDADQLDQQNRKVHNDTDSDGDMDEMQHTYFFSTKLLESCNLERQVGTQTLKAKRCCPKRAPYKNKGSVPGSVSKGTSPYNCPTGAP